MKILGEIGTLAWTRRANGIMTRGERARYISAVLAVQARAIPGCRIAAAYAAGFGLAIRIGPWQD